jgi:HEAT repeat protein
MGLFDVFKRRKDEPGEPAGRDPEIERLIVELVATDRQTREAAARRLGELGVRAASAQSALEDATSDDDNEVCTAAADALSAIRRALDRR